jgi:hypothetical protein
VNSARLHGRLDEVRQRWMPDGSLAVIAALVMPRPSLGPVRAGAASEQPIPLRAEGKMAEYILSHQGEDVAIEGQLRRRYYSRDGEPCWGQVEIWVNRCQPLGPAMIEEKEHG